MPVDLFCSEQKVITHQYRDGYFRTFRGYPAMSSRERGLLYKWIKSEPERVTEYLEDTLGLDAEYSEFLIRELERGYL